MVFYVKVAIIELVDKITKTIEHKFTVGVVLDLSKAFDMINRWASVASGSSGCESRFIQSFNKNSIRLC